jgi:orotate phosphoribosyltransferase
LSVVLPAARHGHFQLESGHHTDLWLDLEALCLRPDATRLIAEQLAIQLRPYRLDAVCGPLNEGAFVALMVASTLGCDFTYAERFAAVTSGLFPVQYRTPKTLHPFLRGRRVGIVNDVISAGSAVRGTHEDLLRVGAEIPVIGSLWVFGDAIHAFARDVRCSVESVEEREHRLWTPAECPLCASGMALEIRGTN